MGYIPFMKIEKGVGMDLEMTLWGRNGLRIEDDVFWEIRDN